MTSPIESIKWFYESGPLFAVINLKDNQLISSRMFKLNGEEYEKNPIYIFKKHNDELIVRFSTEGGTGPIPTNRKEWEEILERSRDIIERGQLSIAAGTRERAETTMRFSEALRETRPILMADTFTSTPPEQSENRMNREPADAQLHSFQIDMLNRLNIQGPRRISLPPPGE